MKITVQEKIAELERRIVALEDKQRPTQPAPASHTSTQTTTTTTSPITPEQQGHLDKMWTRFHEMFGKVFR